MPFMPAIYILPEKNVFHSLEYRGPPSFFVVNMYIKVAKLGNQVLASKSVRTGCGRQLLVQKYASPVLKV